MQNSVTIQTIDGIGDIQPGDDLAQILISAMDNTEVGLEDGDILVIAQKVVSKAEDRFVPLKDVTPSAEALDLANKVNKDPRKIEVILAESKQVVRAVKHAGHSEGIVITEHNLGFICANAAVDESNIDQIDTLLLLPVDPDASARALRDRLEVAYGVRVGVVITDTFGRPWRMGLVNVAIGLAGVPAKVNLAGEKDAFGRLLAVTAPALADELAAASGLLMTKDGKKPALIFKGVNWISEVSSALDLVRPLKEDLFR
jgi:coenzyme F420-0:L-glutamate ligase/coenzyme F420-1:gamma-L-glutamate ligase